MKTAEESAGEESSSTARKKIDLVTKSVETVATVQSPLTVVSLIVNLDVVDLIKQTVLR